MRLLFVADHGTQRVRQRRGNTENRVVERRRRSLYYHGLRLEVGRLRRRLRPIYLLDVVVDFASFGVVVIGGVGFDGS